MDTLRESMTSDRNGIVSRVAKRVRAMFQNPVAVSRIRQGIREARNALELGSVRGGELPLETIYARMMNEVDAVRAWRKQREWPAYYTALGRIIGYSLDILRRDGEKFGDVERAYAGAGILDTYWAQRRLARARRGLADCYAGSA